MLRNIASYLRIEECVDNVANTVAAALTHGGMNSKIILLLLHDEHIRIPLYQECWIDQYLDSDFFGHYRMMKQTFEVLVNKLKPYFYTRNNIGGIRPITLEKATLMTLWYLAKGDGLFSIGDRFDVSLGTVHASITEILDILTGHLLEQYIRWPTREEAAAIETQFRTYSGYPGESTQLLGL